MKIALLHDALITFGGAERVFQYICEVFDEADIYTLSYNPENTLPFFKRKNISVSFLNRFVQTQNSFKFSFPVATYVFGNINLSQYDIAISSSASVSKYIKIPNGKHFCYCYYPTRALWEPDKYFGNSPLKLFLKPLLPYLKKRDRTASNKIDHFIAISIDTKEHIKKYYNRDSFIINCPIDLTKFYSSNQRDEYFLLVSRLEKWKKIDYAIKAFNKLGLPLKVVGTGGEEKYLKRMANTNITFMGRLSDDKLASEYSKAKAVIFTPHLEYGLIPLEANASGAPVIAYGIGGIRETMINYNPEVLSSEQTPTAVFFFEQTEEALIEAVLKFNKIKFDSQKLVEYARKFDVDVFKKSIKDYIANHVD